jgi:hypothetical protein
VSVCSRYIHLPQWNYRFEVCKKFLKIPPVENYNKELTYWSLFIISVYFMKLPQKLCHLVLHLNSNLTVEVWEKGYSFN